MLEDITYTHATGAEFRDVLDEITDLYVEIRAELGGTGGIFARESFVDRTTEQTGREGFVAVVARCGGTLVGFAFGLTMPPGQWWAGNPTMPPAEILDAPKFAVIELDVAQPWRGRGIGHRLHDTLLDGRPEPYAILTAQPDAPARRLYERWGWVPVGTAQHAPDTPVMDQLVLHRRG
jgi:GNAT superfamily N-acetyltransferase